MPAVGVLGAIVLFLPCLMPALVWPLLLSDLLGAGTAWVLEVCWLSVLAWVLQIEAKRRKARKLSDEAAKVEQAAALDKLYEILAQRELANAPWYDSDAGHYRHSTCTVRHRSAGAAGRCSSRI